MSNPHWIYLLKIILVYLYTLHACVCVGVVCRSENHFQESVHSFYHVGPGHWTQISSLGGNHLWLLSSSMAPPYLELNRTWPQHSCPMNQHGSNTWLKMHQRIDLSPTQEPEATKHIILQQRDICNCQELRVVDMGFSIEVWNCYFNF